jgi:hypothetical protein
MPARPSGAKWTEDPKIITNLVYRRDRVGFLEEGFTHIFVVPASGGTPRQLTSGDWDHGNSGISWTPDGREILFASNRVEGAEYIYRQSDIYAVELASQRSGSSPTAGVSTMFRWYRPMESWWPIRAMTYTDDTYIEQNSM